MPDNGKHYFVIYYLKASDDKKTGRQVWSEHKGDPEGTKRLYVDFKKETEEVRILFLNNATCFLGRREAKGRQDRKGQREEGMSICVGNDDQCFLGPRG